MGKVKIREYRPEDLPSIMEHEREFFPEDGWPQEEYEDILKNPKLKFFVACDGDKNVGSAFCLVNQGPNKDETWFHGNMVHPDYRRKGIGTEFIYLREEAGIEAGDKTVEVEIEISNTPSIKMHENLFYVRNGIIKGYYKSGKDAQRMTKKLKEE